ncbi:alpha/beta-hydrolase [Polyplosphaeria fusca]|uniref:Alpha/beta-hydrolase n=1 Tax=Polyplosphaeria fusca TaxID=682080 RepID=A0A9P4UZ13_9PLEO|nr:alpha/beta-hydrolase [Polyplosphaeria fusca]
MPLPDLSGIHKEEIQIPTRDGSSIRALTYRSESSIKSGELGPLFVYFHGGGWIFGPAEAAEGNVKALAEKSGIVTVSIDYRVAPEFVFPTAANDGIDAVKWLAANAASVGADPSKGFIVGGESAGANVTAVVTHEAVDAGLSPPITGSYLRIPYLIHQTAVPDEWKAHYNSYNDHPNEPILSHKDLDYFESHYKPDLKSPYFNPLLWPSGHKAQPPTYFQISGLDPLRDGAFIYEHILRAEHGIPTKVDVWEGIPHGGTSFLPMLTVSKKAVGQTEDGIAWLLSQKK